MRAAAQKRCKIARDVSIHFDRREWTVRGEMQVRERRRNLVRGKIAIYFITSSRVLAARGVATCASLALRRRLDGRLWYWGLTAERYSRWRAASAIIREQSSKALRHWHAGLT
jgi:hypothetical protein